MKGRMFFEAFEVTNQLCVPTITRGVQTVARDVQIVVRYVQTVARGVQTVLAQCVWTVTTVVLTSIYCSKTNCYCLNNCPGWLFHWGTRWISNNRPDPSKNAPMMNWKVYVSPLSDHVSAKWCISFIILLKHLDCLNTTCWLFRYSLIHFKHFLVVRHCSVLPPSMDTHKLMRNDVTFHIRFQWT